MLHEFRDIIPKLREKDAHFAKIFDRHNELDQQILDISQGREHATSEKLSELKKEKLMLRDEAFALLSEFKKEY